MQTSRSTFEIDAALRSIASRQLGLVTVSQAERAGIDRSALARRRQAGALLPVFFGVLRLADVPSSHQQQVLAGALAVPGSVITATSAAVVHGMPAIGRSGDWDDPIVAVKSGRSPRSAGIVVVRHDFEVPNRRWLTARLATPAATLLFLPRFVDEGVVERCLDHCLAHRLTTAAAVRRLLGQIPPQAVHGRSMLLELLAQRAGGIGHRSGLERRVGVWLNDVGLRGWTPNFRVPVSGGRRIEVDFAWPQQQVALEVSPYFTHGSRVDQERDAQRRRLLVERGWRVAEATDSDLQSRAAFAATASSLQLLLSARRAA